MANPKIVLPVPFSVDRQFCALVSLELELWVFVFFFLFEGKPTYEGISF